MHVELERVARNALGSRTWSVDLVLRVGAELAQCVNSMQNLSGRQKADAVLQTIQHLLDDGEKAERELRGGSTATETTTIPWAECKMVTTQLLPVTLDLIIDAARGRLDLKKVGKAVKVGWSLLPYLCCKGKAIAAELPSAKAPAVLVVRQVPLQLSNPLHNSAEQPLLAQDIQEVKDNVPELPKQESVKEKEKVEEEKPVAEEKVVAEVKPVAEEKVVEKVEVKQEEKKEVKPVVTNAVDGRLINPAYQLKKKTSKPHEIGSSNVVFAQKKY